MDLALHASPLQGVLDLLRAVGTVSMQLRIRINFLQQRRQHLRIMHAGICDLIGLNQFALRIHFHVIFVPIVSLLCLEPSHPACGSGSVVDGTPADYLSHSRIDRKPLGIVGIFVSSEPAEHRLPELGSK